MSRRYFDDHGNRWFKPGDMVTRDGTDIHVVVDTNEYDGYPPDGMTVRCTKEPLGYLEEDGTRSEPWTLIGEEEFNTCGRYRFVDPAIEALKPPSKPLPPEWQAKYDAATSIAEVVQISWEHLRSDIRNAMKPGLDQQFAEYVEAAYAEGVISHEQYAAYKSDPTVTWEWREPRP